MALPTRREWANSISLIWKGNTRAIARLSVRFRLQSVNLIVSVSAICRCDPCGWRIEPTWTAKATSSLSRKTLVEHAARTAIASGAHEVVVVVGAESDAVREKLSGLPVRIVRNRDWQTGMGSSIRCGVESLSSHVDSVVISLCDQPQITPDLLRNLASKAATSSSSIAASSYDGVLGAPSAFGRELFKELTSLAGDSGARDIIRNATQPIERVEFSGGNVDIDTPQEYQQLVQSKVVESLQSVELDEQEARAPPVV